MKNLSPINEEKDLVNKKYVDALSTAIMASLRELENADMELAESIGQNATDIIALERNTTISLNDLFARISANAATLGYKAKNLLKVTASSQTINGVTFTVNADRSVTISGTATSQAIFHLNQKVGLVSGTTYKVCSPSSSATTSKFYAEIYNASWGGRKVITTSDVSVSTGIGIYRIVVPSGVTLSDVTVYPMIVSENETDTSFEAYTGDVNTRLAAIEAALGL